MKTKKSKPRKQKKQSCHKTKGAAKKKQKQMHKDGKNAQVKEGSGNCKWEVTSSGNRKKPGKKKTTKKRRTKSRKRSK